MGRVVGIIMPQQRGAIIGRLSRNFCIEFFSAAGLHVRKIERALKDLRLPARVHTALMREGRYDVAVDTSKRASRVWDVRGELESSELVSRPFSPHCETLANREFRRNSIGGGETGVSAKSRKRISAKVLKLNTPRA